MAKCAGKTKSGRPCKRDATDGDFCHMHKPDDSRGSSGAWRPKEMNASGFMTQAAFARLLQVTDGTVRQYCQRGLVEKNDDGLIDVAKALRELESRGGSLRSDSTRRRLKPLGSGGQMKVSEVIDADSDGYGDGEDENLQTQKLRAQIEGLIHKARLHELKADEQEGLLVRREEVDRTAFAISRTLRDQMFTIADRVSAELAGLTDPSTIHEKLTAEISQVCEEAAEKIRNMKFGEDES